MSEGRQKGVGVRLYVAGGQEVRREFSDTGASGKRMWAEIASGQAQANPALRALSTGVGEVKSGVSGLAAETGAAGRILGSFGVAGLTAAAALGGAAIAFGQAAKAMALGDELSDSAAKIGISTDALQEYRYAISQAGGATADADAAIAAFTRTLGAAESGLSPKALKAFTALGFTREDLGRFKDADEALHAVTARIAGLASEAERAAVADKLGLTPMLPLLREGADNMDALRQAAHDLGYVMDADVISAMGEANDKFEAASTIIKTQFASAFVELVPILVSVMQAIADLARQTNDFFDGFRKVEDRQRQSIVDRRGMLLKRMVELGVGPNANQPAARATRETMRTEYDALGVELDYRNRAGDLPTIGGTQLELPSSGGGSKGRKPATAKDHITPIEAVTAYDLTGKRMQPKSADDWWAEDRFGPKIDAKKVDVSVDLNTALQDAMAGFDALRDRTRESFKSGLEYVINGGSIWDLLANKLKSAAINGLADTLTRMFSQGGAFSGVGSGPLSWIATAANFVFGRHATGGQVNPGEASSVAEYGPELALFGRSGQVFSHDDTVRLLQASMAGKGNGAGGGRGDVHVTYAPTIDARGAGPREVDALKAQMARMQAEMPATIIQTVNQGLERRQIRSS